MKDSEPESMGSLKPSPRSVSNFDKVFWAVQNIFFVQKFIRDTT